MRVAINGFGQIGQALAFCLARDDDHGIQIRAINETYQLLTEAAVEFDQQVDADSEYPLRLVADRLIVRQDEVQWLSIRDPSELPWEDLGVDVVI